MNTGLSEVYNWTVANRLSVNYDKTFAMFFSNRRDAVTDDVVTLGGQSVDFESEETFP